jgi:predicted metalloprotease
MPSKRGKNRIQKAQRRSQGQPKGGLSGLKMYGLIIGVIVLAVAVVSAMVILDQGSGRSQTQLGDVSLDKSEGAKDAPVVVVEYGDFQ